MRAHRWAAGCGLAVTMVLWQGVGHCGNSPVVHVSGLRGPSFRRTGVKDLLPMPNGTVVMLVEGRGVSLLHSVDHPPQVLWEHGDELERAEWLLPGDDGEVLVVASAKGHGGQSRVTSLNVKTGLRRQLSPNLLFDSPTGVCWRGGIGWLLLRDGRSVIEIAQGKVQLHGHPLTSHNAPFDYHLLTPDASHGGGLWAIPRGGRSLPQLQKKCPIVRLQDGKKLDFPYPDRIVCSPRLDDKGRVHVLSEVGIERLEIRDGMVHLVPAISSPLPVPGKPRFLDRLPNGDWFALWHVDDNQETPWVALDGIEGLQRACARAAVHDGRSWHFLDVPLDVTHDVSLGHHDRRPSALLPDGTWVMPVSGGLLIRRPDGSWERRNEASGIPSLHVRALQADVNGLLWMTDSMGRCIALDLRKLDVPRKTWSPGWSSVILRKPLHPLPSGDHVRVEWGNPPQVAFSGRSVREPLPLPRATFDLRDLDSLTHDTDGRVWLFGHGKAPVAAYWEQGKWRVFRGTLGKRPSVGATKLLVLESRQGRLPGYQIGEIWERDWVQYQKAGDGSERILSIGRISTPPWFFDGRTWHSPYRMIPHSLGRLRGYPFFWQRNLTIRTDNGFYYMPDADWSRMPTAWGSGEVTHEEYKRIPRLWRKLDRDVPYPYPEKDERGKETGVAPALPVPREQVRWQRWSRDRAWLGTADRLYWSVGDVWRSIPTAGTPLGSLALVSEVIGTASGDIWFRTSGPDYYGTCYARYQVEPLDVRALGDASLGTVHTLWPVLYPRFQANQPEDALRFRHRVDGGKWSPMRAMSSFQLMVGKKGLHRVQLEISLDECPTAPVVLDYTYDVAVDRDEWVLRFVRQLGSRHHAERAQAEKALIAIGGAALPAARTACRSLDPEVAARARKVVAAIELREKTGAK